MKKRVKKIVLIVLSVIILVALGLYISGNFYNNDSSLYESKWNITLPNSLIKQYSAKDVGFTGDGYYYTVFKVKEGVPSFLEQSSSEKNTEVESAIIKILDKLKINKQNYPNFSHGYKWKMETNNGGIDKLYIIYDQELSSVYFVQEIV